MTQLEQKFPSIRKFLEWNVKQEIDQLQKELAKGMGASVEQKLKVLIQDLRQRLSGAEEAANKRITLPLTQYDFADAVGASDVQVNKSLKRLRHNGGPIVSRSQKLMTVDTGT